MKYNAKVRCIIILGLMIFFPALDGFGKKLYKKVEKSIYAKPNAKKIIYADKILTVEKLKRFNLSQQQKQKAKSLYDLYTSHNLGGDLESQDFVNVVKFVNYFSKVYRSKLGKLESFRNIYIHPSKGILKRPIQFFHHKQIYIHFNQFDPLSKKGGYKTFYRSIDYNSEEIFASLESVLSNKRHSATVLKELKLLHNLRLNPHILFLKDAGVFATQDRKETINKFMYHTELFDADLSLFYKKSFEDFEVLDIFLQASQGLDELHRHRYVHRDLKPANILLKFTNGHYKIVLADFGLSQHYRDDEFGRSLRGTRGYIAPDLCRNYVVNQWSCRTFFECARADIYSLGLSFYSILAQRKNAVKKYTYGINSIALDKKNSSMHDSIQQRIDEYRAFYDEGLASHEPLFEGKNDQILYLNALVWRMIHPDGDSRPTLETIIAELNSMKTAMRAQQ